MGDDGWETTIHSQGVSIQAPKLDNLIDIETERLRHTRQDEPPDLTRSPPKAKADMFPGLLGDVVNACCTGNEAVPVAVATNVLIRLSALVGPMVYLPIGDEKRLLNEFVLMVGPTGLGKGASGHGPKRIFRQVEQFMELDFQLQLKAGKGCGLTKYPNLNEHYGGLSSGEGIALALNDGIKSDLKSQPVTDKRLLVFEPEFANVMSVCQRVGNTLSTVLRNAFDGMDIKPLTKRDRINVTNPYICLSANITDNELKNHEQSAMMSSNGMLNRFLIIWQQPVRSVPFPKRIPDDKADHLAKRLAQCVLFARDHNHETHYKKMPQASRPIIMSRKASDFWTQHYNALINRPDCSQVMALTRRHRLHALIISSLLAILDRRLEIQQPDIACALSWCEYSQRSVVYTFNSIKEQYSAMNARSLAKEVLKAIMAQSEKGKECAASDLYKWFHGKIKRSDLSVALEYLLNHIPPLIEQDSVVSGPGRPKLLYRLV